MGMIGIVMLLLSAWWLVALPAIALGIVFLPVTVVVAFAVTFAGTVVPLWATNALAARLIPKTAEQIAYDEAVVAWEKEKAELEAAKEAEEKENGYSDRYSELDDQLREMPSRSPATIRAAEKRAALEGGDDTVQGPPAPDPVPLFSTITILKADVRRTLAPWPSLPLPSAGRAHPT